MAVYIIADGGKTGNGQIGAAALSLAIGLGRQGTDRSDPKAGC